MGYATEADYTDITGVTPSVSVALLNQASDDIDEFLIGSVYATDAAGLPTDERVQAALTKATVRQAQWLHTIGDDGTGTAQAIQSASLGSASYTLRDGAPQPGAGATTAAGRLISSAAVGCLRVAGLLPVGVWVLG